MSVFGLSAGRWLGGFLTKEEAMNALEQSFVALDNAASDYTQPNEFLMLEKAKALMTGYHERWKHKDYEVLSCEDILTGPIQNLSTNRSARKFKMAGKLDVIARSADKNILIDHKTTSEDISDPNSPYWRHLLL